MARAPNLRDSYSRILKFITNNLRAIYGNLKVNGDLDVSGSLGFKRTVLRLVTPATTTHTLTGDDSGVVVMINNAYSSGLTITLPEMTTANLGFFCTIFVANDQTGTLKIATNEDGNRMFGAVRCISTTLATARTFQPGASNDNLVFDGDTKGRLAGSVYHITFIVKNKILVEGHAVVSGTPATAFSDS